MAEYGIPYMGSKSSICNELIKIFPKAEHFYDLFGGGFSVTHAMLARRGRDYKSFHFNEIRPGVCGLIKDAINGKYGYDVFKPEFVSREEFFKKVDHDPYVKIIWSFGNNGKDYLFSKEIEPYKRSMHNAIVFNRFDSLAEKTLGMKSFKDGYSLKSRRLFLRSKIDHYRRTKAPEFLFKFLKADQQLQRLERLVRLQQLEQLEHLQQLQRLQQLERLTFYNSSYQDIDIKENSIVYCDIPYRGTAEYEGEFNHKEFFDWADSQKSPVFISEYNVSDNRFTAAWKTKKRSLLKLSKRYSQKYEKVYVNKAGKILLMGGK